MKATIKELWDEYQQVKSHGFSEEKKKISRNLCDLAEEFISLLSENQKKKFEQYCDALSDLYALEEYEAFEKGVVFTARFLSEAVS